MSIYLIIVLTVAACVPNNHDVIIEGCTRDATGTINFGCINSEPSVWVNESCTSTVHKDISFTLSEKKAWKAVRSGDTVYEIEIMLGLRAWNVFEMKLDPPDPAPKKRVKTPVEVDP